MAKTIKEMAEIYMNKNRLSMYDEDTGEVELIASLDIKRAYQYGANAVLEYIKEVANNCSDITLLTVIKELEGE